MIPRRLFHPTDFSASANVALRFALETAVLLDAELLVGHVVYGGREYWDAREAPDDRQLEARLREHVAQELAALDQILPAPLSISYHVIRHETPAAGVVQFALGEEVDLIVMGTHGRRGIRRLLLGSVALGVLHSARTDLVLIPNGVAERPDGHLLVPVDLHDRSKFVTALGFELSRSLDMPIELLHVFDLPDELQLREGSSYASLQPLQEVALEHLRHLAESVAPGEPVKTSVLAGHPAANIVRHIEREGVGMVLMPASGLSPEERIRRNPSDAPLVESLRWAVGRVTERIVTHALVPVWVVKEFADERETSLDRHPEAVAGVTEERP